jgi:thiamine-phosphate pyrophosphorylase
VQLAHSAGARVVINDRADVARVSGADGVHVGQDDLPVDAVRAVAGPDAVIGLSTHTVDQLDAAVLQPVTYVAIGPVFSTATKSTGYDALGIAGVEAAAARIAGHHVPLVAIGGITLERTADVLRAGAAVVAVIGDLLVTGNPTSRVRAYLERLTV